MAMAVVYTTFAGQIVSENRGGVTREYLPDPLGSTIALASDSAITDTWDYWPYGEVMTRTGTNPTPFTFVGTLGYFKDLLDKLLYVRARHYQPNYGRWLTVDPLWPGESAYNYVGSDPFATVDQFGLQPRSPHRSDKCFVRECSLYDGKPRFGFEGFPAHSWVCAQSPTKSCFGGIPGNNGYESRYGCETGWINNSGDRDWVQCTEFSTDCGIAAFACRCITQTLRYPVFGGSGEPPEYIVPFHVCYNFEQDVAECVCKQLFPKSTALLRCYRRFRRSGIIVR